MRVHEFGLACAIGIATLALVAAGCSSDSAAPPASAPSGGTAAAAGESTNGSATSTTVAQNVDLDTELAEKARLEAIDLPGGPWRQPSASSSSSSSDTNFSCTDPPAHLDLLNAMQKVPKAKTGQISHTTSKRKVDEEIDMLASVAAADDLMSVLHDPKTAPCLREAFGNLVKGLGAGGSAPPGSVAGGGGSGSGSFDVRIEPTDVDAVGDDVVALEFSLGSGSSVQESVSLFVQVGRSVIVLSVDDKPKPTAADARPFAELAVKKLTAVMESK